MKREQYKDDKRNVEVFLKPLTARLGRQKKENAAA
jgi:hypothetical protein